MNLFVDSTDLTEQASATWSRFPKQKQWYLENLLTDIGAGRRLSWEIRQDERAILIGPEPDLKALRPKLLERSRVHLVAPQMVRDHFRQRLIQYLRREKDWTGRDTNWKDTIRIVDLPEDLRAEVVALAQPLAQDVLTPRLAGALGDEAWRQARLSLAPGNVFSKPGTILMLSTPLGGQFLADWPQPTDAAAIGARLGDTP